MTRDEFDVRYKSKRTKLGLQAPFGDNIFYGCNLCGDVIPSSPAESESCSCGNLFVDVENRGVVTEMLRSASLLEVYR